MLTAPFDDDDAKRRLEDIIQKIQGPELTRRIAGTLEYETAQNFAVQGRPAWVPLSKGTIAERAKRNKSSSILKILQDSGMLASSITSDYGPDFAVVGSNKVYAAIHQFGGTIERAPHSTKVRLREDAKGNLLRQGTKGSSKNLAVFAKEKGEEGHKRFRETWHQVDAYQINIPPRPFLPFLNSGTTADLQPEAARSVLDVVTRFLGDALG